MKSVKTKLVLKTGALLLIFLIAVGSALYTVLLQREDAVAINISGRQRMLTRKMTKEVYGIIHWQRGYFLVSGGEVEKYKDRLKKTMELFEASLNGLISGNVELGLPGTTKPEILSQLETVEDLWREFKENIEVILTATDTDDPAYKAALESILDSNEALLMATRKTVKMYERESSSKVTRLIWILVSMVLLSLVVFGIK